MNKHRSAVSMFVKRGARTSSVPRCVEKLFRRCLAIVAAHDGYLLGNWLADRANAPAPHQPLRYGCKIATTAVRQCIRSPLTHRIAGDRSAEVLGPVRLSGCGGRLDSAYTAKRHRRKSRADFLKATERQRYARGVAARWSGSAAQRPRGRGNSLGTAVVSGEIHRTVRKSHGSVL